MAAYVLVSYDIDDADGYAGYVPGVVPILARHGAEILVADYGATVLEGQKRNVHVVLRFSDEDAAMRWYNDPDYAPVRKLRLDSCSHNSMVVAHEFVPPGD